MPLPTDVEIHPAARANAEALPASTRTAGRFYEWPDFRFDGAGHEAEGRYVRMVRRTG